MCRNTANASNVTDTHASIMRSTAGAVDRRSSSCRRYHNKRCHLNHKTWILSQCASAGSPSFGSTCLWISDFAGPYFVNTWTSAILPSKSVILSMFPCLVSRISRSRAARSKEKLSLNYMWCHDVTPISSTRNTHFDNCKKADASESRMIRRKMLQK